MSRVVIHDAVLRRLLRSRQGPVGKIVDKKAKAIEGFARTNIHTKLVSRTGDLEAALRRIPIEDSAGYHVAVGSDAQHGAERPSGEFPYARALETGINPFTGESMGFKEDKSFMVPAVRQAGFRLRRA